MLSEQTLSSYSSRWPCWRVLRLSDAEIQKHEHELNEAVLSVRLKLRRGADEIRALCAKANKLQNALEHTCS